MATSTLLQLLDSTYGDGTTAIGKSASNRRQTEIFIASEAITKRSAVAFDMSKTADGDKTLYVVKATANVTADTSFVGIALEAAAAAGDTITVCIAGVCESNTLASAQGKALTISNTAGELADYGAGSLFPIAAIACEAHSGSKATVIVIKQF